MKKVSITAVIVAVAAIVLAMFLGGQVEAERRALLTNPGQLEITYMPRLGFDKFLADLQWVLVVQQMGGQSAEGQLTPEAAAYFAQVADTLTDLDPDFTLAYQMGSEFIAHSAPRAAYDLLAKAMQNARAYDWKVPFYAGFIAERLMPTAGIPAEESEPLAMACYDQACVAGGGVPDYVHRTRMRFATRDAGPDDVDELVAQAAFVMERYRQAASQLDEEDIPPLAREGYEGSFDFGRDYSPLADWLIGRARKLSGELLAEIEAETEPAGKKALAAKLAKVHEVHEQLRTRGLAPEAHVCRDCLSPHGPGEFFCGQCGNELKAYGYCKPCWHAQRLVLVGGEYCPVCGAAADGE